jgi:hypothetical protein
MLGADQEPQQAPVIALTLATDDPAGVTAPVEKAVAQCDGKLVRRDYREAGHLLVVEIRAQNVSRLLSRLDRIGKLRKPSASDLPKEGTAILNITW